MNNTISKAKGLTEILSEYPSLTTEYTYEEFKQEEPQNTNMSLEEAYAEYTKIDQEGKDRYVTVGKNTFDKIFDNEILPFINDIKNNNPKVKAKNLKECKEKKYIMNLNNYIIIFII